MKKQLIFIAISVLCIVQSQSCRRKSVEVKSVGFLVGTFKAQEVKEGNTIVYRLGASNNIIPGYANYRITFLSTTGKRSARIVEYNGGVFEGIWNYSESDNSLTFSALSPRPETGNLVFQVDKLERNSLILSNTTPNPKTGNTINQYTLIPE